MRAFSAGDPQFNDPVVFYLTNIVDVRSLKTGSKKLAERRRCRRIGQ